MILLTVLLHGYKLRPHEMALVRGLKKHGLKNTQHSKTNLSFWAQVLPAGQPAQSGFEYWYQPPPQKAFLILASQIEKIGFFHSFPGIMKWKVLWHITINSESHNDYFIGWKTQMNTHNCGHCLLFPDYAPSITPSFGTIPFLSFENPVFPSSLQRWIM